MELLGRSALGLLAPKQVVAPLMVPAFLDDLVRCFAHRWRTPASVTAAWLVAEGAACLFAREHRGDDLVADGSGPLRRARSGTPAALPDRGSRRGATDHGRLVGVPMRRRPDRHTPPHPHRRCLPMARRPRMRMRPETHTRRRRTTRRNRGNRAVMTNPRQAPTPEDAKRAAEVLLDAGAGTVLVYGSVARGEATEDSDIDLVAIYDNIDYDRRHKIVSELEEAASDAADHYVGVFVTDRPEWKKRTEHVPTSFEHRISREAITVADTDPGPVDWDKAVGRPTSCYDEAVHHLGFVRAHLQNLFHNLQLIHDPSTATTARQRKVDPAIRLPISCYIASDIVQQSLTTLIHLGGRLHHSQPGQRLGHDLQELRDLLIQPHRHKIRNLLDTPTAQQLTHWNQARIHPTRTHPEQADPPLIARHTHTAHHDRHLHRPTIRPQSRSRHQHHPPSRSHTTTRRHTLDSLPDPGYESLMQRACGLREAGTRVPWRTLTEPNLMAETWLP